MSANNSQPIIPDFAGSPGQPARNSPLRYDKNHGAWSDSDGFAIGAGNEADVLAVNGFAAASVDIGLQAAVPSDYASIGISLGNVVNMNAFADVAASGTVTSAASGQGTLTLTDGKLSGSYTASLSIDITAYLAADKASVQLHVTDSFELSLSGTGYIGATLADTAASGGTVEAIAPSGDGGGSSSSHGAMFDLARFAASVLNTGSWDIAFVASVPGESLRGLGTSTLTIQAVAELQAGPKPEVLTFRDTERGRIAFNDRSPPAASAPYGLQVAGPSPISMFHNA